MTRIFDSAAIATGCLISTSGAVAADPVGGLDGYHHHMWGDSYGFMGGGIMLLSWLAVILVIVFAVKWLIDRDGGVRGKASSSALETLKMRFAKGEIDAKEYEERRKLLED